MYTENVIKDISFCCKALVTNQIARFAPELYVKLTHQTGRGSETEKTIAVAHYFMRCFDDYRDYLGFGNGKDMETFLAGKAVLEYGPGDVLGMPLLFYANGVQKVHCIDRFPLSRLSEKNIEIYAHLLDLLEPPKRERAEKAFNEKGNPASGFDEGIIRYKVTKNGLSDSNKKYDLIVSRAVLEHVNDLEKTMLDIKHSLKQDGISLHQVDLKSHGLDRYTDFDFLTWPTWLYNIMYSHKGFPNRQRVNTYQKLAQQSGLTIKQLSPTGRIDKEKLAAIQDKLAREFKDISPEELSWQGFWIFLVHADPAADPAL